MRSLNVYYDTQPVTSPGSKGFVALTACELAVMFLIYREQPSRSYENNDKEKSEKGGTLLNLLAYWYCSKLVT